MRNKHYMKERAAVSSEIAENNKAYSEAQILDAVRRLAKYSGQIVFYGWNIIYGSWSVGYMAEKPRVTFLNYLQSYRKVYPDGTVKVPHGKRWIELIVDKS